jgi:hypothetical protein
MSGKKIFNNLPPLANIFGKNSGQKKIFLQGSIGFRRAILADTPLIKRG